LSAAKRQSDLEEVGTYQGEKGRDRGFAGQNEGKTPAGGGKRRRGKPWHENFFLLTFHTVGGGEREERGETPRRKINRLGGGGSGSEKRGPAGNISQKTAAKINGGAKEPRKRQNGEFRVYEQGGS